jgi:hypothetical protein
MDRPLSIGVLLSALALTMPCHGDIYVYVDSTGVRHFTDHCTDPRCKLFVKSKTKPSHVTSSSKKVSFGTVWSGSSTYRFGQHRRKPFAINETIRKRYVPHIKKIAAQYDLDPKLMQAIISAESAFDPNAVSRAGAIGLMQLMPDTAKRFGIRDPFDPIANLHGGARYLRWLIDKFSSTHLALAAYNAGEGAVIRYNNQIPPYEETQTYVGRVLDFYDYYNRVN